MSTFTPSLPLALTANLITTVFYLFLTTITANLINRFLHLFLSSIRECFFGVSSYILSLFSHRISLISRFLKRKHRKIPKSLKIPLKTILGASVSVF